MSSGFATQHLLWHTKLEQQICHYMFDIRSPIKKEIFLKRSFVRYIQFSQKLNLKVGNMSFFSKY